MRIVNFSEGHGGDRPVMMRAFAETEDAAMDGGFVAAPELPVGENKIVSNVQVVYEIR